MSNQSTRLVSICLSLAVTAIAWPQPAPVSFTAAKTIYTSSEGIDSTAVGDLNGDGRPDFIVNADPGSTTILLNNGDGSYSANPTGVFETQISIADVNRDGIPDMIYVGTTDIEVALGKGDGTFASPVGYAVPVAAPPYSVVFALVVGDFSGDGWPDIAIAYANASNAPILQIYLNQKNGKFAAGPIYALSSGPAYIAVADLNGDGLLDLALANVNTNNVSIFLNKGAGTFVSGGTYAAGTNPTTIAVGDVNGDGFPDLAVTNAQGVALLLGSAGGTFTAGTPIPAPGATSVALADLNGDGKTDVAVAVTTDFSSTPPYPYLNDTNLTRASVYFGNGTGLFPTHKDYGIGSGPAQIFVVDANDDGHPDLVMSGLDVNILYGDGYGSFEAAPITESSLATGLASADFNHDGTPDVAVVNTPLCAAPCTGTVTVMLGTGKNYLGPGVQYPIGMHGQAIAAGDVNGDGIPDLVVVNNTDGDTYDTAVLLGNGDGTFKPAINQTVGGLSADVILADVNNDGKLDLITDAGVALGDGKGDFGTIIPYPEISGAVVTHVATADFNKDGFLDVALSVTPGDYVAIFTGNGTGNFTLLTYNYPFVIGTSTITAIAAGDLNGDGLPDVAVTGYMSGQSYVSTILNNGNGTFTGPGLEFNGNLFYDTNSSVGGAMAITDVNGDGLPDIVIASRGSALQGSGEPNVFFDDAITVLLNGGGSKGFSPAVSFPAAIGTNQAMAVADFNRDGAKDIVVSSQLGVSLLFNEALVTLSPDGLSWAKVKIGNTGAAKTVTITNNTRTPATLDAAIGGAEGSEFRRYSNTCDGTIAANASCTVEIAFRPTASGKQEATLVIYENGVVIANAPLSGIGTQP